MAVLIFNNNDDERELSVPVWKCEAEEEMVFEVVLTTGKNTEENFYKVYDGNINIKIREKCGVLL